VLNHETCQQKAATDAATHHRDFDYPCGPLGWHSDYHLDPISLIGGLSMIERKKRRAPITALFLFHSLNQRG